MLRYSSYIGKTLHNRYEVKELLGEGGVGQVFKVLDKTTGEIRALKLVDIKKKKLPMEAVMRFRAEAEVLKNIQHNEIVKYYDFFQEGDLYGMVMEYLSAITLSQQVKNKGALPIEMVLDIFQGLTGALNHIHTKGYVHHDIKSSNVLLVQKGGKTSIKLLDFGFSQLVTSMEERIGGTLAYMAPEQTGIIHKQADHRSDQYSLGIVIYELLTGHVPFQSNDPALLTHQHVAERPKNIKEIRGDVPDFLNLVVLKLLNKDPDDRYLTTIGLEKDIQRYRLRVKEKNTYDLIFPLGEDDNWESFPMNNPFVGHSYILQKVIENVKKLGANKKGGTHFFEGVKGVGKTSFMTELYNRLQPFDGTYVFHSCRREEYERPYKTIATVFRALLEKLRVLPQVEQFERVNMIRESYGRLLGLLIELVPETEKWLSDGNAQKKSNGTQWSHDDYCQLFKILIRLSGRYSKRLVIFIDDINFMEKSSFSVLWDCQEELKKSSVVIIGAFNQGVLSQEEVTELYERRKSKSFKITTLTPLTEDDYSDLLQRLFPTGLRELPILLEPLLKATGGIPSVLRSLLLQLIDQHMIYIKDKNWQVDLEKTKAYIQNFQPSRCERQLLAGWSDAEVAILQHATVFQRAFTLPALKELLFQDSYCENCSEEELIRVADKGVIQSILSVDSHKIYTFRDYTLKTALYEKLDDSVRQTLHVQVARHLEKTVLEKIPDSIYDVSYHWGKSGDYKNMFQYYLKTAEYTDDEARRSKQSGMYYQLALKALKKVDPTEVDSSVSFYIRYKAIAYSLNNRRLADGSWDEIVKLEDYIDDRKTSRMQFLEVKSLYYFRMGQKDQMVATGEELVQMATEPEDEAYIVATYNMLGRVATMKSYAERSNILEKGIQMAIRQEKYHQLVPSLTVLVIVLAYIGQFNRANRVINEISEKLKEKCVPDFELGIYLAKFCLEMERGNYRDVIEYGEKLEDHKLIFGKMAGGFIFGRLALAHGMEGDIAKALKIFNELFQKDNEKEQAAERLQVMFNRIQLAGYMDEHETVIQYCEKAFEQNKKRPDLFVEAMLYIQLGLSQLKLGQLEEAQDLIINKAKALTDRLDSVLLQCHFDYAHCKVQYYSTHDAVWLERVNKLLINMLAMEITGFYEIYQEDFKNWQRDLSESSLQSSSIFQGNKELGLLMEINRKISGNLEVETLLNDVLEGAMKMIGAENSYLFMCPKFLNMSKESLKKVDCVESMVVITRNSQGEHIPEEQRKISQTIINQVYDTRKPIVARDAKDEHKWSVVTSILDQQLRSILAVPISLNNELIGILYMDNHLSKSVFSVRDKDIVEMFAVQAAIAINNAQIYSEEQKARTISEATLKTFSKFVPHQFTQRFADGKIENLQTGLSQEDNISVLFSDIRSFTSLSETSTPSELFGFLNQYLRKMETPVRKYNGYVDKFIGDAIMALFDQSPKDAVLSGLEMFEKLGELNRSLIRTGKKPIAIGIGVNTGDVMVGVVGSENRTDTTVLGDAVNVASRVEDLTKYYGCSFLITHETYESVQELDQLFIRFIDVVKVKGKKEPIQLYDLFNYNVDEMIYRKQSYYQQYREGYRYYQNGDWDNAIEAMKIYRENVPGDRLADVMIERCELFKKVPPLNWDGVYVFDKKK